MTRAVSQVHRRPMFALSLSALERRLHAWPGRILSFDVFDTLLARRVHPDALVAGVAAGMERAAARLGLEVPGPALLARGQGHERARAARSAAGLPAEDCDLVSFHSAWWAAWTGRPEAEFESQAAASADHERALERLACFADPAMIGLVTRLRAAGRRLVLASDMYLGAEVITDLLARAGYPPFGAAYVSGDCGLLKGTGGLFRQVAAMEGVNPAEILHVGDNPAIDGTAAVQAGCASVLLVRPAAIAARFRAEARAHRATGGDPVQRLMLVEDLVSAADTPEGVRGVAAGLAPAFAALAAGAVRAAASTGSAGLLAMAREGWLLGPLCARAAAAAGVDLAVPYLPMSRLVALAACATGGRVDARILSAIAANGPLTVATLLRAVGLSPSALASSLARVGLAGTDGTLRPLLGVQDPRLAAFLDDQSVTAVIDAAATRRREMLAAFWRAAGLAEAGRLALLDLGWSAQIQDNLGVALGRTGIATDFVGLYAGLRPAGVVRDRFGSRTLALLAEEGEMGLGPWALFDFMPLPEGFCRAPHGTLLDFADGAGGAPAGTPGPVWREPAARTAEAAADGPVIAPVQRSILAWQAAAHLLLGSDLDASDLRQAAMARLGLFMLLPTASAARLAGSVVNVADLGMDDAADLGFGGPRLRLWARVLRRRLGHFWRGSLPPALGLAWPPLRLPFLAKRIAWLAATTAAARDERTRLGLPAVPVARTLPLAPPERDNAASFDLLVRLRTALGPEPEPAPPSTALPALAGGWTVTRGLTLAAASTLARAWGRVRGRPRAPLLPPGLLGSVLGVEVRGGLLVMRHWARIVRACTPSAPLAGTSPARGHVKEPQ